MPWQWPWRRRRTEDRALFNVGNLPVTSTYAGVPVNPDQAMRLSAVWASVRLLSDTIAGMPIDVYRRGERTPLAPPPLLVTPAAGWGLDEWLEGAMRSLLLRGNAYGIVVARDGDLRPAQVELAHPDQVTVTVTADGMVEHRLAGRLIPPEDVWHVRAYTMPGMVLGLSPVEYGRQQIGLGLAVERFGAQWFGEGAVPAGLLETDADLQPEQAADLKFQWNARHQNHHDIAVLDNGAKYKPITIAPEESQFIETQKLNVAAIARIYGVPPELIAGEVGNSLTYANQEQRAVDFLVFTANRWVVRLERAISTLLPRGQFVKLNTGSLLRTTTLARYQAHEVGLRAGFLTIAEVRALEDLPPLEQAA
jgi:HK97 family phage portal protein